MMVIGVSLGLGALLVTTLIASLKGKGVGGVSSSSSTVDEVLENSKDFTEKYMSDSVVTEDSEEPYIDSAEIVRPVSHPRLDLKYKAVGLDDDDEKGHKPKTFVGGLLTGASVASALDGSNDGREFPWLYLLVFLGGAYVCYRLVK